MKAGGKSTPGRSPSAPGGAEVDSARSRRLFAGIPPGVGVLMFYFSGAGLDGLTGFWGNHRDNHQSRPKPAEGMQLRFVKERSSNGLHDGPGKISFLNRV